MAKETLSGAQLKAAGTLCLRVAETYGLPVATPKHFEALSEAIMERTGVLLSPTTLKRLWGYLQEPVTPRRTTLDVLARYCGWRDFGDFMSGNVPEPESGVVGAPVLRADLDVAVGQRVRLMWAPARVCVAEYLGALRWRVVSSQGTRLNPGDTFGCAVIMSGEPLYLDNLIHGGIPSGVYVCGRRSGVTFLPEHA